MNTQNLQSHWFTYSNIYFRNPSLIASFSPSFFLIQCVYPLHVSRMHLFVSGTEAQCVGTLYQVWDEGHHSVPLTDWIPVKTLRLPLPAQLLVVRRHRLHLRHHACCMRYQVGVQLCKGRHDKETYLYQGVNLIIILSKLLWSKRPGALNFDCLFTPTCIKSEALQRLKKPDL